MDLKRVISAIQGAAKRITVIMPFLYEGRQHHKSGRESMDAALMLKELAQSIAQKNITFTWEETLVDYLVKKSYSPVYGARNLRRTIQKELEDAIAMRLIDGYESPISQMKAFARDNKIELLAM